jgi:hypothetical protein
MGYVASLTLGNTKGIDVLVANQSASRSVGIQVKTSTSQRKEWILNSKAERFFGTSLFYVFVNLKDTLTRPDFYIVPSKVVADYIRKTHRQWLRKPAKSGKPHKDSSMRKFRDSQGEYLEKWELLGL